MKVAFFGVGHMGGPMAANLIKAGHQVTVFDLVPELLNGAVKEGAQAASSAAQAVQGAEVVVSMLPSAGAVRGLYLGDDGVLQQIDESALIIDCSTIDADTARDVASIAKEQGRVMIDAPVSGGVGGAKAGTLTFICGGPQAAVDRARPVLECMGAQVFRAGDNGAGQLAKICNNMLLAIHMIGTAEALQMGVDHGLDPAVLSDIMKASSGDNWSLDKYNPWPGVMENVPSSKNYEGGFAVKLMNKDLGLALQAGLSSQSATPMGNLAKSLYAAHGNHGYSDKDFSSIQAFFQHKND
ncbi:MAG: 3-hydroxyisobutyrate dehydrogenase [Alcanivorax borkumensis]|jgi:3-hydroxyisobutyrate dehydrogenase|uniref:3-hydroxyisobutyrate dehydrogenase n=1 Tax=Alcanivorax borkumensis (strain ATCC 700651 / DSM 11573 / NCIMB 13689 / SK2) TaxID=393595 RepID=Q0VT09_ALCBS|nr:MULTISPECIES: 3-hydroxyisobutyrate dehydrogenase [Alcanivorax]OJH09073.1 MAG: 3-hydroxyisobutyrate dehydrogenase [Alcanivorax borkumensis]EUC70755.1 3-hydroxyisobutyrate dehydrogenase [Alcanivorax sp. 97CO-5]PKG02271.1 3-hydroxyisobutyrate dehydrogenase [Alcanivorax sp. 97CO-6]CAL15470.1 3-hydroxyisobutyrate dehydrogenase [Alcanivorax borkumensis SK2]BAP12874.1 3-hydroxyisobutyrate dehydrogenase [Alcanivorax sp. NBRC 101098]